MPFLKGSYGIEGVEQVVAIEAVDMATLGKIEDEHGKLTSQLIVTLRHGKTTEFRGSDAVMNWKILESYVTRTT